MNYKSTKKCLILVAAFMMLFLCACSKGKADKDKLRIVATGFSEYDWTREILGDKKDKAELTYLLDRGVDIHSFEPTADDIIRISQCDIFIYVGGESDNWVPDVLKNATNKDMKVIKLMEVLGDSVKEEEIVEGMQAEEHDHEHGEEHDKEADEDHDHEEEGPESDEHIWLSLKNAQKCCAAIEKAIEEKDSENAEVYKSNLAAYTEKLAELDTAYAGAVEAADCKTLLFGDRFPFRYLTSDYGLTYYAAFAGCSAETEASFETVLFLAGKVDELGLKHVIVIDGSDGKLANTIIDSSAKKDCDVLTLNSLQSVSSKDIEAGCSYITYMEKNLEIIKQALD